MNNITSAKFFVGQLIQHKLFDYRGVIVDVDATFQGSDEWYQTVALTRPPRDEPWYHVLVHGAIHRTYAAERNLAPDTNGEPIEHPEIGYFFDEFKDGAYITHRASH
jgi:heat shock protein HspQ